MSPGASRNPCNASACEENSMLKISFSETPVKEKWILEAPQWGLGS